MNLTKKQMACYTEEISFGAVSLVGKVSLPITRSLFNSSFMLNSFLCYVCWAAVSAILDLIGLLATCLGDLLVQMVKKSLWTNAKSHFSLYLFINHCYKLGHSVKNDEKQYFT